MPSKPPPIPTLAEINAPPRWFWACCFNRDCGHERPLPFAPFIIRWGPNVSSDMLRKNLKCSRCGHRGNGIRLPSWVSLQVGEQPFPVLYSGREVIHQQQVRNIG